MKASIRDVLFIVVAGCYLLVIGVQRLYPFIDLPNHLSEAAIYKDQQAFQGFYSVNESLAPNGFHYYFCSIFSDVEIGNKVYYCLYVLLFSLLTYLIIKKWKGNVWFSFLPLLLLFNYNVTYGFTGFTWGILCVLFIFYLLSFEHILARLVMMALLVALFYLHILCLLFALFLIVVNFIFEAPHWKPFLKKTWIILPALGLIVVWYLSAENFVTGESTPAFLARYYTYEFIPTYYKRAKVFAFDNFSLFSGYAGLAIGLFFTLMMLLPVIFWWSKNFSKTALKDFFYKQKKIVGLVVVSTVCCFALPDQLPDQQVLYQRFSVFLMFSLILMGSVLYREEQIKGLAVVFISVAALHLLLWRDYFSEFDHINTSFTQDIFMNVPDDELMGGLVTDLDYRGRPVYIHFPNYRIIWNKKIATTSLIDYRFGSIRRVASRSMLPEYQEWAGIDASTIPVEYAGLRYLLLKGKLKKLPDDVHEVAVSGDWKIIRKGAL